MKSINYASLFASHRAAPRGGCAVQMPLTKGTGLMLALLIAWSTTSTAAEISAVPEGISVSGQIVAGDYKRLATFVMRNPSRLNSFLEGALVLNSPGGNVDEAMKIANLLDRSFAATSVLRGTTCASSCFLLWAAGASRSLSGTLGVHRLSLRSSSADIRDTEHVVRPAAQAIEAFLSRVGIPRRIVDKMTETAPSDLFMIDGRWLIEEELGQD